MLDDPLDRAFPLWRDVQLLRRAITLLVLVPFRLSKHLEHAAFSVLLRTNLCLRKKGGTLSHLPHCFQVFTRDLFAAVIREFLYIQKIDSIFRYRNLSLLLGYCGTTDFCRRCSREAFL